MTITPEQIIEALEDRFMEDDRDEAQRFIPVGTIRAILAHIRRKTDPKWKLVLVEPAHEMVMAGLKRLGDLCFKEHSDDYDKTQHMYRAMLSAAPTQE